MKNIQDLLISKNFDTIKDEIIVQQVVVRVWKFNKFWIFLFLLAMINALPFLNNFVLLRIVLNISILWMMTYSIRERWRLTLTNHQIVARQLFPRPFTFFSKNQHFPLRSIEGFSVGPKTFNSILLVGLFFTTNIGVTLLKSGLSEDHYDLPDTMDAIIYLLKELTFIPWLQSLGTWMERELGRIIVRISSVVQISLGISFIFLGIIMILITIPRRHRLQIRVRHGNDFLINAGIPPSFWRNCYSSLYSEVMKDAPKEYARWNFPWLQGEKVEGTADLEQTIYINRILSIFAVAAGTYRVWARINDRGTSFFENDFIFWVIIAVTDVIIAFLAIIFSKKKNEMLVTNKRIIFAREMIDISGAFGKRLYQISDIKRDDIAGFTFRKIKVFSPIYVVITLISFGFILGLYTQMSFIVLIISFFLIISIASFITQTYVEFNLTTKGGELWHMRHQLANPMTIIRRIVGEENRLINSIFANRLEEKEVIDIAQIIRATDLDLKPKLFADSKVTNNISKELKRNREIQLDDILLHNEKIIYQNSVSKTLPKRKLTLFIASSMILILLISFLALNLEVFYPILQDIGFFKEYFEVILFINIITHIFMIIALWIVYYSIFKTKFSVTNQRVFHQDTKEPPYFLYITGNHKENIIHETLRNQIHSTFTSRQYFNRKYSRSMIKNITNFIISYVIIGISIGFSLALIDIDAEFPSLMNSFTLQIILVILYILFLFASMKSAWCLANAMVEFMRLLPRRMFNAKGVGVHYMIPYLSKQEASELNYVIQSGKNR
ncbi:MAG: hypothetical protein OEY49_03615 [Candidatus Heimdallarchaeota archaeon]|nr:hypothetical protein [Candidatus Heimdallarchaeota archaeon]